MVGQKLEASVEALGAALQESYQSEAGWIRHKTFSSDQVWVKSWAKGAETFAKHFTDLKKSNYESLVAHPPNAYPSTTPTIEAPTLDLRIERHKHSDDVLRVKGSYKLVIGGRESTGVWRKRFNMRTHEEEPDTEDER